jgi:hypothetical protein
MQFVFEFLFHLVFEILAYQTGKIFAPILLPRLKIEPLDRQKIAPTGFTCRGSTYRRGKQRYLYAVSVQALGIAVWIFAGVIWFALSQI